MQWLSIYFVVHFELELKQFFNSSTGIVIIVDAANISPAFDMKLS